MAQDKKPRGRPTTRIDTAVLVQLRQRTGLTQLGLAEKVYRAAGKTWFSQASLKNTGQRWEKNGTLDGALVPHLASVLESTVEELRGEHPLPIPDPAPRRVDELEVALRKRAKRDITPELDEALQYYRKHDYEDPIKALAQDLNSELELAPLTASPQRWVHLSAITGLPKRQLLRPVSHEGLWLLIANGLPGPVRHELLGGVVGVMHAVRAGWAEHASAFLSRGDSVITFTSEGPWLKISWMRKRVPKFVREMKLVRCQPTEAGLNWVATDDNDEFWLEKLSEEAYEYFDYVKKKDGAVIPMDVSKLRILIGRRLSQQERDEQNEGSGFALLEMYQGSLAEMPASTMKSFTAEGLAKSISVTWLSSGLWEALRPHLADWPLKYWSFRAGCGWIGVELGHVAVKDWRSASEFPPSGTQFSITLVELTSAGLHRPAPWSKASVEGMCSKLNQALRDAQLSSHEPAS